MSRKSGLSTTRLAPAIESPKMSAESAHNNKRRQSGHKTMAGDWKISHEKGKRRVIHDLRGAISNHCSGIEDFKWPTQRAATYELKLENNTAESRSYHRCDIRLLLTKTRLPALCQTPFSRLRNTKIEAGILKVQRLTLLCGKTQRQSSSLLSGTA